MKKVIFVGGTSYSGSTFFDMTLANDPHGFSLGEVNAVYYPYRRKHLDVAGLSKDIDWARMKRDGAQNLYSNIFDQFPDVNYIVDSSKSPLWISERSSELTRSGIDVKNILIWKNPAVFRKSRKKRNQESGWMREWLNYHRYYMTVVNDWRSVKYDDLVNRSETLETVCRHLGIDFFEGKKDFWEKNHHTLFGNATAKIHLFNETSNEYNQYNDEIKNTINDGNDKSKPEAAKHKTIYQVVDNKLEADPYIKDSRFSRIANILIYTDVYNEQLKKEKLDDMRKDVKVKSLYKLYQSIKQKYSISKLLGLVGRI